MNEHVETVKLIESMDKINKLFNAKIYGGDQHMTIEVEKKFNIRQNESKLLR